MTDLQEARFYTKAETGREKIAVNIGKEAWTLGRASVYTAYSFLVRAELKTEGSVRGVGLGALKVVVWRMLNKRTLPHLRPGENVWKVTAERAPKGLGLELEIAYRVRGEARSQRRLITAFPHYFRIDAPGVAETVHKNYDQRWNDGALQMSAIRMRLRAAPGERAAPSLPEAEALAKFAAPSPHPADMTRVRTVKRPERDARETSGFFPQAEAGTLDDDRKMNELIKLLAKGTRRGKLGAQWLATEDLGDYPKALDALLEALPAADIDLTLFLCKALSRMPHPKAIAPLLAKWRRAPRGSPGTRYIPDVLAAIGDRRVVGDLIAPLKRCRFDFRFHIAHALGILGGPRAAKALEDLAANDPFPAVRDEAKRALERLRKAKP